VITTCIGERTMNNPEKIFVRSVLKSNDLKYDWFKVKTTSSFLGFIDNLEVVIEPDYKKKLLGEYKRIKQQYRTSMKSSRNWSYYNGEIRPLVMEELARRYPRHNTSD
jgi:hypothetical protein